MRKVLSGTVPVCDYCGEIIGSGEPFVSGWLYYGIVDEGDDEAGSLDFCNWDCLAQYAEAKRSDEVIPGDYLNREEKSQPEQVRVATRDAYFPEVH